MSLGGRSNREEGRKGDEGGNWRGKSLNEDSFLPEIRRKCPDVCNAEVQGHCLHSVFSWLPLLPRLCCTPLCWRSSYSLPQSSMGSPLTRPTPRSPANWSSPLTSPTNTSQNTLSPRSDDCPISILRKAELTIISDFHLTWNELIQTTVKFNPLNGNI